MTSCASLTVKTVAIDRNSRHISGLSSQVWIYNSKYLTETVYLSSADVDLDLVRLLDGALWRPLFVFKTRTGLTSELFRATFLLSRPQNNGKRWLNANIRTYYCTTQG